MSEVEKYKNLDDTQRAIRVSIMDMIIEEKRCVTLNEVVNVLSSKLSIDRGYLQNTLDSFIKENVLVAEGENINFIYPVSALSTSHNVTLDDGREFYAMCAIDAIGTSCTFHQNVTINSMCCVTGQEIKIRVEDEQIKYVSNPNLRVLHVDLDKHSEWAASC
jgi:hypothetical protein